MKDTNTVDLNYRLCTLLGVATSLIIDVKRKTPRSDHYKIDWFLEAINEVVYLNNPLPPFPENEL